MTDRGHTTCLKPNQITFNKESSAWVLTQGFGYDTDVYMERRPNPGLSGYNNVPILSFKHTL